MSEFREVLQNILRDIVQELKTINHRLNALENRDDKENQILDQAKRIVEKFKVEEG